MPALTKAYKTLRGSLDRQLRPGTQATAICYYRRSKLPFARPQRPKTLRGSFDRQLLPGTQATAVCYYRHLSVFEAAVCAPSNLKPSAAASTRHAGYSGIRGCRLPALKGLKPSAAASTRHAGHSHLLLSAFEAAVCPPSKALWQLRPGTQATAICDYRRSRLPFARPQMPKTLRGTFDQALRRKFEAETK